jgi:hypothetical protein
LVGEKDPMPLAVFTREYIADVRLPEAVAIELSEGLYKNRKGRQFVQLEIVSGSEQLFAAKAVRVK